MRKLASMVLCCAHAYAQTLPTWTTTTFGPGLGYSTLRRDPSAGGMIIGGKLQGSGSISIFVSDWYNYSMSTGLGTHIVGTGSLSDTCPVDLPASYGGANPGGLPNRPGDRHPVSQQATDTKRNLFWLGGGINRCFNYTGISVSGTAITAGVTEFPSDGSWVGARVYMAGSACATIGSYCTIASVTDATHATFTAPGPGTGTWNMVFVDSFQYQANNVWNDMYYLILTATPTGDTWTRAFPTHTPLTLLGGAYYYQGSWQYDAADDKLLHLESTKLLRYCSTVPDGGGSPTGTLSAAQTASGCSTADDWESENTSGPGQVYPGWIYDPVRQIMWKYGGSGSTSLWAYNPGGSTRFGITSHAWQQFCSTGCTPPSGESSSLSEYSAIAWNSARNTIHYHLTSTSVGVSSPADYEYDPLTDRWTLLQSGYGSGNTNGVQIEYDPTTNKLVSSGTSGTSVGAFPAPGPPFATSGAVTLSGAIH